MILLVSPWISVCTDQLRARSWNVRVHFQRKQTNITDLLGENILIHIHDYLSVGKYFRLYETFQEPDWN